MPGEMTVALSLFAGDPKSDVDYFTDGLWHKVIIDIMPSQSDKLGRVNITVDGIPDVSDRQLSFTATAIYIIGGQ